MRAIVSIVPGEIELNWTFLPSFIGLNSSLKKEIEDALRADLEGMEWTEATLDKAHGLVVDYLVKKFSAISGLREYLDSLRFISEV
jgi:hypothetical protein